MSEAKLSTNLASEFHVLSVLHRLELNATLTLGNKKSVDLVVVREAGDAVTIDVKGLRGKNPWPVDNVRKSGKGHFLVFVCYCGKIADPEVMPEVWVVPSSELAPFVYEAPKSKRRVVRYSTLAREAEKFRGAWNLIAGERTDTGMTEQEN